MQQLSVAVVTEINFDLDGREKCQGENKHLVAVIINVLSGPGVFCLLGKQSKSPLLRETAQDGGTDSVIWEVPKYMARSPTPGWEPYASWDRNQAWNTIC